MLVEENDPNNVAGLLPQPPNAAPPQEQAPIQGPSVPPGTPVPTGPVTQPAPAPQTEPQQPQGPAAPALPPMGTNAPDEFVQAENKKEKAQADLDKATADQNAEQARQKADLFSKQQTEREEHETAFNATRERLSGIADQAVNDVQDFKFRDYMSTRTAGQKAEILLGGFLSGLGGAKSNEVLDNAIARDFEAQKAQLTSKENIANLRQQGVRDFDQHIRDQRLVLDHKEALARDSAAAEMEAKAAQSGNPVVMKRAEIAAADMRAKAADTLGKIQKDYADTQYSKARTQIALNKAKGTGVGGSNGKQQALTEALTKSGGEITPEVAAVADKLKIKSTDLRGMAQSFKQERRADLQERKQADTEIKQWAKDNGVPELLNERTKLKKITGLLDGNESSNPTVQLNALMEFDRASKGGSATAAAMRATLEHMAGGVDKVDQFFQRVKTGGLSQEQLSNLRDATHAYMGENDSAFKDKHDSFQTTFRENPLYAGRGADMNNVVNSNADTLFSGAGYSRKPAPGAKAQSAPANPATATPAGPAKGTVVTQGNKTYQFKGGNPNDPTNWSETQ